MPFVPHSRITLSGDLGSQDPAPEHFSFGFSTDLADYSTPAAKAALKAACDDFMAGGTGKIGNWATLRLIKVASIGVDGKYTADAVSIPTATPGNGSSPSHPFQISLAVGLRTAVRGGSHRGRLYLPAPTIGIQTTTGLFDMIIAPGIEAGVRTFLHAACAAAVTPTNLVVASRKGFNTNVSKIQVGGVLDTMRSRRRQLPESYGPGTAY